MPTPPRRLARIALLLISIAVISATQAAPSFAATPAARPHLKPHRATHAKHHAKHRSLPARKAHSVGSMPAQGMFDSCSLNTELSTCEQDLVQMRQAGMQVAVVSAEWDSLDALSSYASYAQSIGMSIMWELNDPGYWGGAWIGSSAAADWSPFSTACGCTETTQVLDYMIRWLGALPATYGYYAADDWTLTPADRSGLTQYVNEIKAVDPAHMVMVGSAEGDGTTYYSSGATMGNEIYPETTSSLMPYNRNIGMWQSVEQSIGQDQRAATDDGTSSAFILQAFTFGDNVSDGEAVGVCTAAMSQAQCASLLQYPSASVQMELRDLVLQHADPKLILWYTYGEASQGNRWADLTGVVKAPYPVSASTARARQTRRARDGKRGARRRSVAHTLAA